MCGPATGWPERFLRKVLIAGPDDCWPWVAGKPRGYGCFLIEGSSRFAHRLAWQWTYGEIPNGLCVCHRCDNPACCNPAHLFLGTQADNVADMDAKGRRVLGCRAGERNNQAKLTEAQVLAIRTDARLHRHIAAEYGVSPGAVGCIKRRETWAHLPEEGC